MNLFPDGVALQKAVSVKVQPTPKIQSEFARKCGAVARNAFPPAQVRVGGLLEMCSCSAGSLPPAHREVRELFQ
jgi:hypothetical protein